jgi:hypothetical protein
MTCPKCGTDHSDSVPLSAFARDAKFPYYWRVRTRLPGRFGQRCAVLVRGRKNTALVEFEDGYRVTTSRNYVRRVDRLAPRGTPERRGRAPSGRIREPRS